MWEKFSENIFRFLATHTPGNDCGQKANTFRNPVKEMYTCEKRPVQQKYTNKKRPVKRAYSHPAGNVAE